MELDVRFAKIKDECSNLGIPRSARDHFRARLEYFRLQSLCDHDRRDKPQTIAKNWQAFADEVRATNLLQKFRADKTFWREIAVFVGELRVEKISMGLPKAAPRDKPAFHTWDMHTFFERLIQEAQLQKFRSLEEKKIAMLGLRYLFVEAKRGRLQRDIKACKQTWLEIWPSLNAAKILDKYKGADQLQGRLRFFLENKF